MNKAIIIDPGHGIDTAGKRSPLLDGVRLFEWQYSRTLATLIVSRARALGINTFLTTNGSKDISLSARASAANLYIRNHPNERCIMFSLHGNASGNGSQWMSTRGFEAWTTIGKTNSDELAEYLCMSVHNLLPSVRIRADRMDGDFDKEKNFTVIYKANCPAVLSENLFYDNIDDVRMMLSHDVQDALAEAHVRAALMYFSNHSKTK